MFHRFLIWPLIAGLRPFEVLIRKMFIIATPPRPFELNMSIHIDMKICIKVRVFNFSPLSLNYVPF